MVQKVKLYKKIYSVKSHFLFYLSTLLFLPLVSSQYYELVVYVCICTLLMPYTTWLLIAYINNICTLSFHLKMCPENYCISVYRHLSHHYII